MAVEILYPFILTCLALILSPGPDLLYVISQSILRGPKYGYAVVIGQMGGLVFHLCLFAIGVSALITESEILFKAVRYFGAAYLLWLSFQIFMDDKTIVIQQQTQGDKHAQELSLLGFVKKGLLMNVLNPKIMLFFLALFPGFITVNTGSVYQQVFVLGAIFISEALLVFSIICALAGQFSAFLSQSKGVHVFLKWLQIIVFCGLAIFLVLS